MASEHEHRLRPLRLDRTSNPSRRRSSLPNVPKQVPRYLMAPDRSNPTEGNGDAVPRGHLHIALVAPDNATAQVWRRYARVVTPPSWNGIASLHVVVIDKDKSKGIDATVLQALVDLGFADPNDIGFIGYPSGADDATSP